MVNQRFPKTGHKKKGKCSGSPKRKGIDNARPSEKEMVGEERYSLETKMAIERDLIADSTTNRQSLN